MIVRPARAAALALALLAVTAATTTKERHAGASSASAASAPAKAEAASRSRLEWRPEWSRFHPVEYGATATLGVVNAWLELGTTSPPNPLWTRGILFDDAVREIRARDHDTREAVSVASDVTSFVPQAYVILVDSLLVPALDGAWGTALQMQLFNAEAYAITGILTRGFFRVFPRERPVVAECREDPNASPRCLAGPNASFPSGHTAFALNAAALSCAHHLHMGLFGSKAADVTSCVAGMTVALSTGVLRVLDDRHWASDVILGALIGSAVGFLVPTLHYRGVIPTWTVKGAGAEVALAPTGTLHSIGGAAIARF